MRGRRRRTVGLSIGSRTIALAEIHIDASGAIEVSRVEVADMPADAIDNGRLANPASVSQAIRELFAASDIDGAKEMALAIPNEGSITRLQVLPSMSRNEILEALLGEVENFAALSGGEPALDFQITNRMAEGAGQQIELLYVATPRELLNSYLSMMETAGLEMSTIETRPLAILRALVSILEQDLENDRPESQVNDKVIMLASIEENVGMIIVVRNNIIEFIHNIEIGSNDLQSERDFRGLALELRSSVDYYRRTFSMEGSIENIILFIDGSDMVNIGERLEEALDLPIIQAQVPAAAGEYAGDHSLSAYAAIGAAIGMVTSKDEASINLLSSSRRPGMASLRKRVGLFLVMLLSVALLFAGARLGLDLKADSIEKNLISLKQRQKISGAKIRAEISDIQRAIAALEAQTNVTDAAINSIKWANCAKILQEIRAIIPKNVWLNSFRWKEDDNAILGGYALSYDPVFNFRHTLISSPYFDPVKIIFIRSIEISEQEVVQFEIRCGVKKEKL